MNNMDSDKLLMEAAEIGDAAAVQQFLQKGANVKAVSQYGSTALIKASFRGHAAVVQLLLAAGANVNAINQNGVTPLFEAADRGHSDAVKVLLAAGANINAVSKYRGTPLCVASEGGHAAVVQLLLAAGANVNAVSQYAYPPLHLAAAKGHSDAVQVLLAAGANVNAIGEYGDTPLYVASEGGHAATVQLLVEAGGKAIARPRRKGKYSNSRIDQELDEGLPGALSLSRMTAEDIGRIYEGEDVAFVRHLSISGMYFDKAGNTAGNRFGEAGATVLAGWLHKSPALTIFDLGENEIGDKGLQALAASLGKLTSLTRLNLERNRIGDLGAHALAGCLGALTSLTSLNLCHNQIGDSGAQELADCLGDLASLETLDFGYNQIGDGGAQAVAGKLRKLTSLKNLDFMHCHIGDAGALALAGCLGELPSLKINLEFNQIGDEGLEALRRHKGQVNIERGNCKGWDEGRKRLEAQKTRLVAALRSADFRTAEGIFAAPFPPTVTDALFLACASPETTVKTVDWLIKKGAQVNARGRLQRTPLHEVILEARQGEWEEALPGSPIEKVRLLVAHGADLTAREENDLTPLAMAQYLRKHKAVALLSGTSDRTAWEQAYPVEASYEATSKSLVRGHGPLVRVQYLSHWPKFEIKFHYQDGTCIYSGPRNADYDINFLSLGYVGQGPRYAMHFLHAAGFHLTADEIAGIKAGDSIVLRAGKAAVVSRSWWRFW
jgi:ankyrin repeat protein